MKMKLTAILLALLPFAEVSAHASHSHAFVHNVEHILLLSALLPPLLLIARPGLRRLAARRTG
jgi:hypothetical protein